MYAVQMMLLLPHSGELMRIMAVATGVKAGVAEFSFR